MTFNYQLPTAIHFDVDAIECSGAAIGSRHASIVCSEGFQGRGSLKPFLDGLGDRVAGVIAGVPSNPTIESVCQLAELAIEQKADVLIAVGGGSVIDAAKGIAAVIAEDLSSSDLLRTFLEGGGKLESPRRLPVIALPTTSGTGSEVTSFATIWDMKNCRKYSIDGPQNAPEAAILDPSLSLSLPESATASTSLDALSQGLESLWNKKANPITIAWACEAIRLALATLPKLFGDLSDRDARRDMALSSLLSGMCISQTRTGIAHAMSYPLTAHYGTPHGIACSFTLSEILADNLKSDDGRFARLAAILRVDGPSGLKAAIDGALESAGVWRRLSETVSSPEQAISKFDEMFTAGRADTNFVTLPRESIMQILERSLVRLA